MQCCGRMAVASRKILSHKGHSLFRGKSRNHQIRGRLLCYYSLPKQEPLLQNPLVASWFSTIRHDERRVREKQWRDEKKTRRGRSSHNSSSKRDDRQIQEELDKCTTVTQVLEVYEAHRNNMNPWDLSFCWYRISVLVGRNRDEKRIFKETSMSVQNLLDHTTTRMRSFGSMPLSSTASSIARISTVTGWDAGKHVWDRISQRGGNIVSKLKPRSLASIVWAFAKVGDESPMIFDRIARVSVQHLDSFNSHDVSNLVWAYATAGHASPELFSKVAKIAIEQLNELTPQGLANTVWSFATAGHRAPDLFDAVADVAVPRLHEHKPQDLANIVWAFATDGHEAPELFDAVSEIAVPRLNDFNPQEIANTVWAFATAGHDSPQLFDAVSEIAVPRLNDFNPQEISNSVWAFATAGRCAPELFDAVAEIAAPRLHEFKSQNLANTLWAFATVGRDAPELFDAFCAIDSASNNLLTQFNAQELANAAWACAALDHPCEALLRDRSYFMDLCQLNANAFEERALCQLHQFRLWCQEQGRKPPLPSKLQQKCLDAFANTAPNPSKLQTDVIATLKELGLNPQEEVRTKIGYDLDAVVTHRGCTVAVEVDGPSHFHDRSPTGSTILKRRQLVTLENWCLVSIPYWEWHEMQSRDLAESSGRRWRDEYTQQSLDGAVSQLKG